MPVQFRLVLHPLAPPTLVGVVFIVFVLGGTEAVLCLLWPHLLEVRELYCVLGQCLSVCGSDNC